MSEANEKPQGLSQRIAALPLDNIWYAIAAGFFIGFPLLAGISFLRGKWEVISIPQFYWFELKMFGVLFAATAINKKRMGSNWSNQYWLERLLLFVANSVAGQALAVFVLDQILHIEHEGLDLWLRQ